MLEKGLFKGGGPLRLHANILLGEELNATKKSFAIIAILIEISLKPFLRQRKAIEQNFLKLKSNYFKYV